MTPATCRMDMVSGPSAVLVHNDPDVSRTPLDRHRVLRKPPPNHGLPLDIDKARADG